MGDSVSRAVAVGRSVEFDGQVRSVLAEQLAVVVADGPERREAARLHGVEEVLPPAALQVHEALQALLGVGLYHLQAVRHVRLVKNPGEEEEEGGSTDYLQVQSKGNQSVSTCNIIENVWNYRVDRVS